MSKLKEFLKFNEQDGEELTQERKNRSRNYRDYTPVYILLVGTAIAVGLILLF